MHIGNIYNLGDSTQQPRWVIIKPRYLCIGRAVEETATVRIGFLLQQWSSMVVMTAVFSLMLKLPYFEHIKGCWLWADTVSPSQLLLEGKMKWYALCVSELLWWHCVFNWAHCCRILTCTCLCVFQLNVIFLGIALYKMFHHTAILKPDSGCLDNIK